MKLCIAGKNNIAVYCLQAALEYQEKDPSLEIVVVYNRTECGKNTWQKSLKYYAECWNVPAVQLEDVYGEKELVFLSLEYDRLLVPQKFATNQLFNIHFSLLPAYKGMYTSSIPFLQGEKTVGVTLHRVDSGIDTGEIIEQVSFDIEETDMCRSLYAKYISYGTELVKSNLKKIIYEPEKIESRPQTSTRSSYFSKKYIDYQNLTVELRQTAYYIVNQIRAFAFREYQLPIVQNTPIVWAKLGDERTFEKPGTILEDTEYYLKLATIDYAVYLYKDKFNELLDACRDGKIELVKKICYDYAYQNDQNEKGITPLLCAVSSNQKEVACYLAENGADISVSDYEGNTPLMYAEEVYKKSGDSTLLRCFQQSRR